jgi:hypothetical protein
LSLITHNPVMYFPIRMRFSHLNGTFLLWRNGTLELWYYIRGMVPFIILSKVRGAGGGKNPYRMGSGKINSRQIDILSKVF